MGRNKNGKRGFYLIFVTLRHFSSIQGVKIKKNLDNRRKKGIVQHTEENEKLNRVKIALDFSMKFNRSITGQCVTKTIAKKAKILRTSQAMVQTNNLNLRNRDSHICFKTFYLAPNISGNISRAPAAI